MLTTTQNDLPITAELGRLVERVFEESRFDAKAFKDTVYAVDPGLDGIKRKGQIIFHLNEGMKKLTYLLLSTEFKNGNRAAILDDASKLYDKLYDDYMLRIRNEGSYTRQNHAKIGKKPASYKAINGF